MKEPTPHSDQRYIEALLTNDHKVIKEIYLKFSGKVVSFVRKNNGDISDAGDVIQDTLMTIFRQAYQKELVLTCPFDAYFFLLCKRKWLNRLKKNFKNEVTIDDKLTSITDNSEDLVRETEIYEKKNELLESKFKELGKKCRKLLKLTFTIKSMEEVAKALGVTYGYVRKKKSLCMGQLTKLVQASNAYKNLNDL